MIHEYVAAFALVAISVGSARLYGSDHKNKDYKNDRQAMDSPRAFEFVYHWIRITTLVAGLGALLSAWDVWLVIARSPAQIYAGLAFAIAGFVLFVAAKRTLGRHYSPCYDSHVPMAIVQNGVYAKIRHPIYTANLATLFGFAVATGSVWIAVNFVVLLLFYWRSAVREEDALGDAHPEYRDYKRRSGRFLPNVSARGDAVDVAELGLARVAAPDCSSWMREYHYSLS